MLTFKQFLNESETGNYVSINVETSLKIDSLEPKFGGSLVCDPSHQHVTLIYSEGTNVAPEKISKFLRQYEGKIEAHIGEVAAFDAPPKDGERDEKLCTIVVKLKSNELENIHKRLKSELGLKHSYSEFSPHISVLYNLPIEHKEEAIKTVGDWTKENTKVVTLKDFNINPIIKNWADDKGKK